MQKIAGTRFFSLSFGENIGFKKVNIGSKKVKFIQNTPVDGKIGRKSKHKITLPAFVRKGLKKDVHNFRV